MKFHKLMIIDHFVSMYYIVNQQEQGTQHQGAQKLGNLLSTMTRGSGSFIYLLGMYLGTYLQEFQHLGYQHTIIYIFRTISCVVIPHA